MDEQRPPFRRALPTDARTLAPPGPAYDDALAAGLSALRLQLDDAAIRACEAQVRLLLAWTESINLTAVRTPGQVARLHVVDSLSALPVLRVAAPSGASLLDLGSGGGYPGLPLAMALPAGRTALLDSIAKKVRFLSVAAAAAQAAAGTSRPIETIAGRAEDLARDRRHRGRWEVVTARAVGTLAEVAELGLPLLRTGALLVCWKRLDAEGSLLREIADAGPVIAALGGGRPELRADPEPALPGHRLVLVRKLHATPERFPRSPAERRRNAVRTDVA